MKITTADNRISTFCNWNVQPSIDAQCYCNLGQAHHDFVLWRDNYC
jgi:hypothetical protein